MPHSVFPGPQKSGLAFDATLHPSTAKSHLIDVFYMHQTRGYWTLPLEAKAISALSKSTSRWCFISEEECADVRNDASDEGSVTALQLLCRVAMKFNSKIYSLLPLPLGSVLYLGRVF